MVNGTGVARSEIAEKKKKRRKCVYIYLPFGTCRCLKGTRLGVCPGINKVELYSSGKVKMR